MRDSADYKTLFEEAYIECYARMKRFAQQYVIREEDAENIVHDIFLEFWEKQREFSSFESINGFLFIRLKNKSIDFLRRKTLEQYTINEMQSEYIRTLKLNRDALELLDNETLAESTIDNIILKSIDQLPEKCRRIFILNKFEGKKQRVIAEELNISVNTVESQMAIAYKKLKEELKNHSLIFVFFFI